MSPELQHALADLVNVVAWILAFGFVLWVSS
jgi:hypothetical protein